MTTAHNAVLCQANTSFGHPMVHGLKGVKDRSCPLCTVHTFLRSVSQKMVFVQRSSLGFMYAALALTAFSISFSCACSLCDSGVLGIAVVLVIAMIIAMAMAAKMKAKSPRHRRTGTCRERNRWPIAICMYIYRDIVYIHMFA